MTSTKALVIATALYMVVFCVLYNARDSAELFTRNVAIVKRFSLNLIGDPDSESWIQGSPRVVDRSGNAKLAQLFAMEVSKKFIVITSIAPPTKDVLRLASEKEWTLVVVGDTKTPSNWSVPGVHFLSVDLQKELGYAVLSKIPFRSYARKTIGYLYAIERGAEWIYDTDDDNKPFGKGLLQFDYDANISGIVYRSRTADGETSAGSNLFQPYAFFGRPDIWPRGFPLEEIKSQQNNADQYVLCKTLRRPSVQQGLVKKDPDVDAIYRLLRGDRTDGLNEDFSRHAPPVTLGADVFSPFNSQNTLFHRSAFFTMWLPVSVAFRVTDIWRSYFAQKLLHLIHANIAFYPPNAVQFRNAHNYLKDFKEEESMYEDAERLVKFLGNWTCTESNISLCMVSLAEEFVRNGFWGDDDGILARRWIHDLLSLGYSFPPMGYDEDEWAPLSDSERFTNCRRANLQLRYSPVTDEELVRREENAIRNYRELDKYCGTDEMADEETNFTSYPDPADLAQARATQMFAHYRDMALIITSNFAFGPQTSILQRIYEPFFAVTIYCGPFYWENLKGTSSFLPLKRPLSFIHMPESQMRKGYYAYYCAAKAMELRLENITGFVVQADDAVFNMWIKFNPQAFVETPSNHKKGVQNWWSYDVGLKAMNYTVETLVKRKYKDDQNLHKLLDEYSSIVNRSATEHLLIPQGWRVSDFFYLPTNVTKMRMFYGLSELFFEGGVFHEIVLDKISDVLDTDSGYQFKSAWGGERGQWERHYNADLLAFHPVKLSGLANKEQRAKVCKYVINEFKRRIFSLPD